MAVARTGTGALPDNKEKAGERARAVFTPRPEYPFQARQRRITGAGIAVMEVDPATGDVTRAYMSQSTGSWILDNAAISAFSRWRFKKGTVTRVRTPIRFTLGGMVSTKFSVHKENMDDVLARFLGKGTVVKGPIPTYPRSPEWTEKSGKGVFEMHAGADGKVATVRVLKSSGDTLFDQVAVRTLRKWRLRRGPLVVELPLAFTLTPTIFTVMVAR